MGFVQSCFTTKKGSNESELEPPKSLCTTSTVGMKIFLFWVLVALLVSAENSADSHDEDNIEIHFEEHADEVTQVVRSTQRVTQSTLARVVPTQKIYIIGDRTTKTRQGNIQTTRATLATHRPQRQPIRQGKVKPTEDPYQIWDRSVSRVNYGVYFHHVTTAYIPTDVYRVTFIVKLPSLHNFSMALINVPVIPCNGPPEHLCWAFRCNHVVFADMQRERMVALSETVNAIHEMMPKLRPEEDEVRRSGA